MRGVPAEVSVWAYPWDLADIGVDEALARMGDAGATMTSLAASYHAGRFLQPGNPRRRVYFPEDGTVYWRLDARRWEGELIRPLQARSVTEDGDMMAALLDRRDRGGARVSAWTVCLHNTRLGTLHPDHVTRTAHGDPNLYALCPSSPAARGYATGLVAEIAALGVDRIEVETPDFMGFAHGFHHEKDGLPSRPEDAFLLGLCFCAHCESAARRDGAPFEEARQDARALLDAAFAAELPPPARPLHAGAFADRPALHAFLRWRPRQVAGLLAELRAACPAPTRLLLIDWEGSWQSGVEPALCAPHLDGALFCAYTQGPAAIPALLAPWRALVPEVVAGFQLFHPTVRDAADLAARVRATEGLATGLNVYNLGLVPPARLGWLRAALR
mgnify:CR=1 FL=1